MIRSTMRRWSIAAALVTWLVVSASQVAGLTIAAELIGVTEARSVYPDIDGVDDVTGAAQRIAVLDTGIDFDHPGFADRVVAGINYAAGGEYGSERATYWSDGNGHGTSVAGIVGSSRDGTLGVTPEIELVSVRVLADNGEGSFNDVVRGLQWVNDHAAELNITAVNLSLGSDRTYATPNDVPNYWYISGMQQALDGLESKGVITVAASGNSGSTSGLSLPAILDDTISVGGVSKSDAIGLYSNRSDALDLLAPGSSIASLRNGGGTRSGSGTSFAAPFVTAASALVREMIGQYTTDLTGGFDSYQDHFLHIMRETGEEVFDATSGQTFTRLDVLGALDWVAVNIGGQPPRQSGEFGEETRVPEPAGMTIFLGGVLLIFTRRRAGQAMRSSLG